MVLRAAVLLFAICLVGCAPAPVSTKPPPPDPTKEAWYSEATSQLVAFNRELEESLKKRRMKLAADLITKAQPVANRLLSIPKPSLAATEAVSGFDHLYGRLLLANRQYGFARFQFQRNVARWKNWTPQTGESQRRLKLAESAIAECDRLMSR